VSTKPVTALLAGSHVKSRFPKQTRTRAEHGVTKSAINISGNQFLLVLAMAFLLTNGLIWAFVRYWLFAP
jgi:hypothetical protein